MHLQRILKTLSIILILLACESPQESLPEATIQIEGSRLLQRYALSISAEISSAETAGDFSISWDFGDGTQSTGNPISHIYQNADTFLVTLTISGESTHKIFQRSITINPSLELVQISDLTVDSPSGLSFGLDNRSFWTVSDKPNGRIVQLDLQGQVLRELNYYGDDLEGVSFDSRDSTLWIVDESLATLFHLDTNGVELESMWISGVSDGSGLEGVTVDEQNSRIFLLKEKNFSALLILDDSLETRQYQRIGFASDYSGLYYSHAQDRLWILSDEESKVFLTDTLGTKIDAYGFDMLQPEGLVFNEADSTFYIVDDTAEKLYRYKFWD